MNFNVRFPTAVFQNYAQNKIESEIRYQVHRYSHQLRHPLPPLLVQQLRWMPHLVGQLIVAGDGAVPLAIERQLCACPYVAFFAMRAAYNVLGPRMEEIYILNSPIALTLVIREMRQRPKLWLHDEEFYLTRLREIDPARYYMLLDADDQLAQMALLRTSDSYAAIETPGWAYINVVGSNATDLAPQILQRLAEDEHLLVEVAALLHQRGATAACNVALREIRTPRAAFHALRNDLATADEVRSALLEVVCKDAVWAAELFEAPIWNRDGQLNRGTEKLRGEPFKNLYLSVATAAATHPCNTVLHRWALGILCPKQATLVQLVQESAMAAA